MLHCRKKIKHLGIICKTQQGFGFLTLANYKSLVGQTSMDRISNIICKKWSYVDQKIESKDFLIANLLLHSSSLTYSSAETAVY